VSALGSTIKFETDWYNGQVTVTVTDAPDHVVYDIGLLINSNDLVTYHVGVITFAGQVSYEICGWDSNWKTVTLRKVKE
jgi:hypothetical protein